MNKIGRRGFIVSTTALAGMALGGFPVFAQSGDMPDLADRLPKNPLIVTPTDRPGAQGGHLEPRTGRRWVAVDVDPVSVL